MNYIKLNNNGEILELSSIPRDGFILCDEEVVVGVDGKLYKTSETTTSKYIEIKNQFNLKSIRAKRETECFFIVNRGKVWYDKLSEEQKTELSAWYQQWLDAPQTGVAPETPKWIKR